MTIQLLQGDALEYLRDPARHRPGPIVTSLPDIHEMEGISLADYRNFFLVAAFACLQSTPTDEACVFYQTDLKQDGWVSKASLLIQAAEMGNHRLLWHKIVLRREVGKVDMRRPGYGHLMAFSRAAGPGSATPDVIPPSPSIYSNGIPIRAAEVAVRFAGDPDTVLIDPFCGRGTVLAVADKFGIHSVGVDIDPRQIEAARHCREALRALDSEAHTDSGSREGSHAKTFPPTGATR